VRIPFLDLGRQTAALASELEAAFRRVAASGRYLFGPEVEAFEAELAAWLGARHVVAVASGTDALEIALRALGVAAGEPVATTAFTAVATVNAIEAAGGAPVLVDIDATTRNAERVAEAGCRLAVAVHLHGLPCRAGADVEDVAHALGARVGDRRAGTLGAIAALSFYPTKNLGALGDGGAIVTGDAELAARAPDIRHYGGLERGEVAARGQNSRLGELQAAFLRVKLPRVDGWNARRRAIAARYREALAGRVGLPAEAPGCQPAWHVFAIEHPERDRLARGLADAGVGTMVHYPRAIHEHARYRPLGEPGRFPVAERLARTILSLPCYPELRDDEIDEIVAAVRRLS
jgi:dTDP-3-amino-3,4,6-trideoxy-alpha-D-glucose transaminase